MDKTHAGGLLLKDISAKRGTNDVNTVYAPAVQAVTFTTDSTVTQVASSATAITLLAANNLRRGATIGNDSTAVLYVILGNQTPATNLYTVQLPANGTGTVAYYEVPFGFVGKISGIWGSANGNAYVTELT